jgi:hypothetical protein
MQRGVKSTIFAEISPLHYTVGRKISLLQNAAAVFDCPVQQGVKFTAALCGGELNLTAASCRGEVKFCNGESNFAAVSQVKTL